MKRLIHRVFVVLIGGVVMYGGCQQLQTTPVSREWSDPESQLNWQADFPSDEAMVTPELATVTNSNKVDTVARSLAMYPENEGSSISEKVHSIEPKSAGRIRDSVITSNIDALENQTLTPPGRSTDSASTSEYSSWPLPDPTATSERLAGSRKASPDGIFVATVSATGPQFRKTENANCEIPTVDRSSPFVGNPGHSETADNQDTSEQVNLVRSIPVSQILDEGKHSNPDNIQTTTERRNTKQSAQRERPVPSPVIEQRAMEHLEYGKSLARRGATYAAREEFIHALRLIAESNDMQSHNRDYTEMLAEGLRALKESDDFVSWDAEQQLNIDVARIIATHDSKVISESMAANLSPINAMQMYFQFAAGKISVAAGQSMTAADVLHAMGKLLQSTSQYDAGGKPMDRAKAIVMFQAALEANPGDYRSANELGVLLAQNGKWELAKELFAKSLLINKSPESWLNLSRAHEQLGEREFARLANIEYQRMVGHSNNVNGMEWVSVQQFEADGIKSEAVLEPNAPQTARMVAEEPESQGNKIINGIKNWF